MHWKATARRLLTQVFARPTEKRPRPYPPPSGARFRPQMEPLGDRVVPATLALWNFNSPSPDGNPATGTTAAAVGSGTLTAIGGVSTSFVSGAGSTDSGADNSALNLTAFPTQGTANKSAGVELAVDTTGYGAVVLTFDQRNTAPASALEVVQFSPNGGANWFDAVTLTANPPGAWANARTVVLPAGAASNNPNLRLRIVAAFNGGGYAGTGGGYAPSGAWALDSVRVEGAALPTVTVAAINDAAEGGAAGTLRFTRTGSTSAALTVSYAVSGSATAGTDYTALTGTVTFAAGAATADVTVAALHDGVIDDDETVSVTVTSGTGYAVGSPASDSVTIIDTDILPVAFDGWVTTSVNEDADVEVLDLATSLYGDTLTVTGVTDGDHGTVVINLDGTVTYTPDTSFVGDDTFTYTVEDPFGNEATGTVSVTVTAPVAPPTSVWTGTNTAVIVEVLDLAFDPDGDTLTTAAVTQGTNGTVVINLDGTVTYTPNTSFTGDDSFTYTVEDPDGNEASHTITVTVGPTDPVALDNAVQTDTDTPVTVSLADLAFQPAGGSVTFTVSSGSYGTVVDNLDGTVTYTPDTSYTGTDTFSYIVTDASFNTASGTITVTVGPIVASPVAGTVDALESIEELLDNYDDDTPDAILAAFPDIEEDVDDYVDDVTSLISANSVAALGANLDVKDFAETMFPAFKEGLYSNYLVAKNLEAILWDLLGANKNLMDSINDQIKAELMRPVPNGAKIELLTASYKKLGEFHNSLIPTWGKVWKARNLAYNESAEAWLSIAKASPTVAGWLTAPPVPANRVPADLIPK
ncbi:outer membrane adhesin-like protein : Putative hemagglutinin/hemolysin-related protein OS=Dickeya dadantii (strain 3937) GN=Dda3937_01477 PE=4 SV=1: Calx-beta [Gemmataceae bacterium]|nr:outer membrane adhesin-like protein : Putative hemagglutinin/hemolysin-related protein OS=Dickeya dadantii (strain 3937) GN=Dda3937_01477 PE=4 SV=1: Calx-beta [Gemmataceae bacterium]VTU00135.1 outer membrane adhesin-like protein : Putative hemagglutinin/hemolysin-related protein OS=Dickeya dadantii (strain 3937) GN=Dda3937_01477 PE=4 SV=1: Calx-beta [Gemmataceae bacterium]